MEVSKEVHACALLGEVEKLGRTSFADSSPSDPFPSANSLPTALNFSSLVDDWSTTFSDKTLVERKKGEIKKLRRGLFLSGNAGGRPFPFLRNQIVIRNFERSD